MIRTTSLGTMVVVVAACSAPRAVVQHEPERTVAPVRAKATPVVVESVASAPAKPDESEGDTESPPPERSCGGESLDEVKEIRARADAGGAPWGELSPSVAKDIAEGRPLVVYVYVPLCSNQQIWCGSSVAGDPMGLNSNIYWGAIFGSRRFFDDYHTPFERVETKAGTAPDLERIVYRQVVSGSAWGRSKDDKVEQLVVLQAVHGSYINDAVARFWETATRGGCVSFRDGDREREERIHVVGYAGHNRLMDGVKLPAKPSDQDASPIPSFVLACFSEKYFGPSLREAGARPLVTTRSYMAPEGYLVRAIAEGLGRNESPDALRERAATAQRSWQKSLSVFDSRWIFWPFEP